jgi:hypothetical protein
MGIYVRAFKRRRHSDANRIICSPKHTIHSSAYPTDELQTGVGGLYT